MRPPRKFSILLCFLAALTVTGCETTGDPRQGGLWGWSEAKARDRQALLRDQLVGAQEQRSAAAARSASLRSRQSSLRADVSSRSAKLNRLQSDVTALQQEAALGQNPSGTRARAAALEEEISSLDSSDPQMQEMLGRVRALAR